MIDKVQTDELQSGHLMVKALKDALWIELPRRKVGGHACMRNNEMKIKEIVGETILDG
jgi:hypothetical protein